MMSGNETECSANSRQDFLPSARLAILTALGLSMLQRLRHLTDHPLYLNGL